MCLSLFVPLVLSLISYTVWLGHCRGFLDNSVTSIESSLYFLLGFLIWACAGIYAWGKAIGVWVYVFGRGSGQIRGAKFSISIGFVVSQISLSLSPISDVVFGAASQSNSIIRASNLAIYIIIFLVVVIVYPLLENALLAVLAPPLLKLHWPISAASIVSGAMWGLLHAWLNHPRQLIGTSFLFSVLTATYLRLSNGKADRVAFFWIYLAHAMFNLVGLSQLAFWQQFCKNSGLG